VDLALVTPLLMGLGWAWFHLFEIRVPTKRLPLFDWLVQLYLTGDPLVIGGALMLGLVLGAYFGVSLLLWGTTLGHRAAGLTIVDRQHRRPGPAAVATRVLGSVLSAAYLGLGFVWILFDRHGQGFHDKIAGTYVVRVKGR
jgi:uncharacterized RDD family membrane protein YckC